MKSFRSRINTASHLFLTCEHASRLIPREYPRYLGLSRADFSQVKDVDDIGALDLTRELLKRYEASYLWATISRAVLDVNRQLVENPANTFHACAMRQQLLTERDGVEVMIDVPINQINPKQEEKRRFQEIAVPYQSRAKEIVDVLRKHHEKIILVQVHSFFREYNGEKRKTDIGILFREKHRARARKVRGAMRRVSGTYQIDLNKPYDIAKAGSMRVAMDQFEDDQDVTILIVEVANDLLRTPAAIRKMSRIVQVGIDAVM